MTRMNVYRREHIFLVKKLAVIGLAVLIGLFLMSCRRSGGNGNDLPNGDDADLTPTRTVTETKVVLYDGPNMMTSSDLVDIYVGGEPLFVYESRVNHSRIFSFTYPNTKAPLAIFDFEGRVEISVVIPDETALSSAIVTPLAYGIEPSISGNTITFTIDYPTQYTIEYNQQPEKAIHLFANPLELDTPDPNNIPENMIYIGPGVHKADAIPVQSNQTVYIAGGAVVYGQIRAEGVTNVTVRGRGIIDGSIYHRRRAAEYTIPIEFRHSTNIHLEGITFLDSAGWTIASYFVDGFVMDNIKIITARANGDGISLQSSKNVHVKNGFVRTWDDSLVVKNYNRGTTENILFENMILWTDLAQSMEIGYETYGETMTNITFRDITVLHNFHKPVISIHNADDANISHIRYQNITIEDAQVIGDNFASSHDNFLFDFQIQYNQLWSSSGGTRGHISNVLMQNIEVLDGRDDLVARIAGYGSQNLIDGVVIANLNVFGAPISEASQINMSINDHARQVSFSYDEDTAKGARLHLPYLLDLDTTSVTISVVPNIEQEGFLVPGFAIGEVPTLYMGQRVEGSFDVMATRGTGTFDWNDGSGDFEQSGFGANHVLDENLNTLWLGSDFQTGVSGQYAALSIAFNENKRLGTIRIYGKMDSEIYQLQNVAIYGIRSTSTNDVYVKLTNSEDFEFSPAKGNFVDINISPGEFKAIQIRFYQREGLVYPSHPFASRVEFYPASLSFNQAVTASPHEDVYDASNITDGNRMTYYESRKGQWPANLVINMGGVYDIRYISIYLPPLMQWEPRSQEIQILYSMNGIDFTEVVGPTYYHFDPMTGNVVEINLGQAIGAQYVKFIITDNTAPGGYGAQVSQINIFQ